MGGSDVAGASWRGSAVGFGAGGSIVSFFFFQAEDGIRDKLVTGVQTCALPICPAVKSNARAQWPSNLLAKRPTIQVFISPVALWLGSTAITRRRCGALSAWPA